MAQALINGLAAGAGYALLAFGFGLVYFTTGVFHFAHGAAFTLAGYVGWALSESCGWPLLPSVVASVAAAAALGWAVEVWLYRPLRVRRASSDALFLTSLGVYTVVANALALAAGHDTKPLAGFSNPSHVLRAGGEGLPLVITQAQVLTMAVALVLFVGLWPVLKLSRFGLAMRAYAANPTLASVLGVDDRRLLPRVAALGAGLGGVAAWCTALDVGVSPDMGLAAVVTGAVAVVVGGVGSLPGTALGGLLLGLLQQCGRLWLDARWEEAVTFGVLLGVLLLRPRGLLGGAQG